MALWCCGSYLNSTNNVLCSTHFLIDETLQRTLSRNFDVGHSGHYVWDTWDTLRGTLGTLWHNTWDTLYTSLGHY